jgi:hypothetical protein
MRPGFAKEERPRAAKGLFLPAFVVASASHSRTCGMCTVDSVHARQRGEQQKTQDMDP